MQILSMPLRHWAVPPPQDIWVLVLSVLVALPHLFQLPVEISGLCVICWGLDLFLVSRRTRLSKVAKVSLLLLLLSTLVFTYSQLTITNVGFAIAVLMIAMKPLETNDQREYRSFVILSCLSVLLFFFRDGNAFWFIYYLCCLVGLTSLLLSVDGVDLGIGKALRKSGWLFVQALPIAVILFFGIPRIERPFLQWNVTQAPAVSGVPDRVRLDRLGPMKETNDIAFEATFDGPAPDTLSLYWRGTVFYFTDGRSWDSEFYSYHPMAPGRLDEEGIPASGVVPLVQKAGKTISYQIKKSQPSDNWLITLDLPVTQIESALLTEDFQLIPHRSFDPGFEYRMTSALSIQTPRDSDRVFSRALRLPSSSRAARQTRLMGQDLRTEFGDEKGSDQKIIQRVLRFFSQEPFYYALEAPGYRSNPIDQFLFEGRYGYCTHYASAMTVILRAAGVPARMVSGYHGGDWNLSGEKLVVRQRHAHAWVEAWVDGHGWLRIDPTAAIPQERVLTGSVPSNEMSVLNHNEDLVSQGENAGDWREFLSPSQLRMLNQDSTSSGSERLASQSSVFSLRRLFDQPRHFWDMLVTDFDHTVQQNLFGKAAYFAMAFLLLAMIAMYAAFAAFRTKRGEGGNRSCRVGAVYRKLCRRLIAGGVPVFPHEPYQSLHERLARTGRFDGAQMERFFGTYERLRYQQSADQVSRRDLRELRQQMKRFLADWKS